MKSRASTLTLIIFTSIAGFSGNTFGAICYDVGGEVTTENVTPTLQMGSMEITLSDGGSTAFDAVGSLVGNITGTEGDPPLVTTLLSHTARFPQGNSFVTSMDAANLAFLPEYEYNPVRTIVDGEPCSFWIHETVTEIAAGTRFFKNVSTSGNWEIHADGYISNCPGENENYFVLSGTLCIE